jgi:Tfp pilus assembly protein PilN
MNPIQKDMTTASMQFQLECERRIRFEETAILVHIAQAYRSEINELQERISCLERSSSHASKSSPRLSKFREAVAASQARLKEIQEARKKWNNIA